MMRAVALAKDERGLPGLGAELTGSYRHLVETAAVWKKLAHADNPLLRDYRSLLEELIGNRAADHDPDSEHRKVQATVDRALEFFKRGQKTLVFCVYTKTAETIRDQLHAAIERYLGQVREGDARRRDASGRPHASTRNMQLQCRGEEKSLGSEPTTRTLAMKLKRSGLSISGPTWSSGSASIFPNGSRRESVTVAIAIASVLGSIQLATRPPIIFIVEVLGRISPGLISLWRQQTMNRSRLILFLGAALVLRGVNGLVSVVVIAAHVAPRTAAAPCGRRWSARQCRCSGFARIPPRGSGCSDPGRLGATSPPASCGARTQESTPECATGLAPRHGARSVEAATRPSRSGRRPRLQSIACTLSEVLGRPVRDIAPQQVASQATLRRLSSDAFSQDSRSVTWRISGIIRSVVRGSDKEPPSVQYRAA